MKRLILTQIVVWLLLNAIVWLWLAPIYIRWAVQS